MTQNKINIVKRFLLKHGFKQRQLGNLIGLEERQVRRLANGESVIRPAIRLHIESLGLRLAVGSETIETLKQKADAIGEANRINKTKFGTL